MANGVAVAGLNRNSATAVVKTRNARQPQRDDARNGPLIINLGCGLKTSDRCINVDWSIYIILYQNPWLVPLVTPLIGRDRVERIKGMSGTTICHDLKKGIPFPDDSADAVYHSHTMEHIDREVIPVFQKEVFRVLKPGGIQRICVPNLENYIAEYNKSLASGDLTREASVRHDALVANILEQSVRKASSATWGRRMGLRLWLENRLIGDARARGETHQWMWDKLNARAVLMDAGFVDITLRACNESGIDGWDQRLELDSDGREYKPGSLYLECRKPGSA